MTTPPASPHCPECGAILHSGAAMCWLCNREAALCRTIPQTAVAQPTGVQPAPKYQTNWWAKIALVLAATAMFPAALIAFGMTCDVAVEQGLNDGFGPDLLGFVISVAAGLVVLGGFVLFIIAVSKHEVRRLPD